MKSSEIIARVCESVFTHSGPKADGIGGLLNPEFTHAPRGTSSDHCSVRSGLEPLCACTN